MYLMSEQPCFFSKKIIIFKILVLIHDLQRKFSIVLFNNLLHWKVKLTTAADD
jgi:hypothetical protein